jgi:hypothetical protein
MKTGNFNEEDFNWTEEPVIGMALAIQGGTVDSNGNKLIGTAFYKVGKRKSDGVVALIPVLSKEKSEYVKKAQKEN